MESRISFSGTGQKEQQKHSLLPPLRDRRKNKNFLTLLRGKPNGIAHGSIIQSRAWDTHAEFKVPFGRHHDFWYCAMGIN